MPEPNGNALTEVQRTLMAKIKETPGISQSDIATLMKLSNATVNYHMERLLKKGVVRRQRAGMKYKCYLTEEADRAFVAHEPAPPPGNN
jgi:predicted transcriptional regulator